MNFSARAPFGERFSLAEIDSRELSDLQSALGRASGLFRGFSPVIRVRSSVRLLLADRRPRSPSWEDLFFSRFFEDAFAVYEVDIRECRLFFSSFLPRFFAAHYFKLIFGGGG